MALLACSTSGGSGEATMGKANIPSSPGGPSRAGMSGSVFTKRTRPLMVLVPDFTTWAEAPSARPVEDGESDARPEEFSLFVHHNPALLCGRPLGTNLAGKVSGTTRTCVVNLKGTGLALGKVSSMKKAVQPFTGS